MHAVGRLGNYISRGVYTVSGPFHPFGGAVDIIVVVQPDGSYKSSPWYVRFGKFQGMLKTKEKLVSISVNGVEANFHMHLDSKGEAFFLKEVDIKEAETSSCSPPSSGENTDKQSENIRLNKSKFSDHEAIHRTNSGRSQITEVVLGRRTDGGNNPTDENVSGVPRTGSYDRAQIAADLLDLKWSTNLASPKSRKKEKASARFTEHIEKKLDDNLKGDCRVNTGTGLVSQTSVKENGIEMKCLSSRDMKGTAPSIQTVEESTKTSNSDPVLLTDNLRLDKEGYGLNAVALLSNIAKADSQIQESVDNATDNIQCANDSRRHSMTQLISVVKSEPERDQIIEQETFNIQECVGNGDRITFTHEEKICTSEGTLFSATETVADGYYSQTIRILPSDVSLNETESQNLVTITSSRSPTCKNGSSVDPHDDPQISSSNHVNPCIPSSGISNEELRLFGEMDDCDEGRKEVDSSFSLNVINGYMNDTNVQKMTLRSTSSDANINTTGHVQSNGLIRSTGSLPNMSDFSDCSDAHDLGNSPDPLSGQNNDQLPCEHSMTENVKIITECKEGNQAIAGTGNCNATEILKSTSDMAEAKDAKKETINKEYIRSLIPTSDQLRSLNLKEGKNVVVFTFSTAMLGDQQVDARIYLWRWDTRIVISDVDGTITRSDLLGQVMPLVGMDWSQTGVAHLFSAIKENGYQFLFLSARAISQAFLTRQFLFNIKQDGKALPDGPVVISPDGLFPSLFREVVRRAPHEFKIACLEDIKVLFPVDANPFYAGFGNRDTDELSYLKVGIPRNKIFIINPKGEVVVNRRVDTKSYVSLHGLVNGMFPIMTSSEQEDYNSWNYWKLPAPIMDD